MTSPGFRARGIVPLLLGLAPLLMGGCASGIRPGSDLDREAGRPDLAVTRLEREVAKHPDDADLYLELGRAYAELDSAERAVSAFTRAGVLDPGLRDEIDRSRKAAAERFRRRGLSELTEAAALTAESSRRTARLDGAAEALRGARLLAPEAPEVELDLYRLAWARGDSIGAEPHLVEATRLATTLKDPGLARDVAPIYQKRGQDAVRGRDYRRGITLLDVAARLVPDDPDILTDLASAYLLEAELSGSAARKGAASYGEADRILERVRIMRPDDPDVLYNLATIRLRSGSVASADSLMRAYLGLRIEDADGWQLFEMIQRERPDPDLARLAALAGDLLALDRSSTDPAARALESAERHGPSSALGRFYARHGAPERIEIRRDRGGHSEELWIYIRERRVAGFKDGAAIGAPIEFER